ncbi:penicillin-binding protein 2 [Patescibacteria group bacterium]|nr:penicillin-binding protein 2 [Patescibacteria group bacterium]MBU2036037.1 penicillin-binding protein 2 [Patescibacteria group bacterium]
MQKRILFLRFGVIAVFIAIISRLFYWQIIQAKVLSKQAKSQHELGQDIQAPRGNILANDGSWLAAKEDAYILYAEIPNLKESTKTVANKIAPFLIEDSSDKKLLLEEVERIQALLDKKETVWVALIRRLTPQLKSNIEALHIDGLGFERMDIRVYPEASSSAHLLGFVGKEEDGSDIGYFGLEGYYNLSLQGKQGFFEKEKDALGNPINVDNVKEISAIGGVDLLTNIDKTIQMYVEKELKKGLEKYSASSGTVIVMNPKDGGIIAMSSFPSFEPDKYWNYSDDLFRNPVVSYSFEPGSIFKIFIMASALDSKSVKPDTVCDVCDGPYKVDKYSIETWNNKYFPDSTMIDVIVHSDNVGMSFVSDKMGSDLLYDYLRKFGFGDVTGIDLQGEFSPKIREKGSWNIVDLATASFGQGIAVTPIQLIKAGAIIANGGVDITPQVVDKLQGVGWVYDIKPQLGQRVIGEKAAKDITAMMVEAAKNGEAKWTALRGFKVAGKTGTAQIPIAGHYDSEKTIASFIGFAPADNPKFVMLVTLQEPKSSPWASETAAPLWFSIAKDLFSYYKIQPSE